ncbi:class I SAM-dependent methyltransferase [Actinomadura xylanilytica]|uniref:class I SAM-dependent methyltransferase n=1 Tax=Actinomadura xylanilytica TaxID=887459 RepID=UPI00255B3E94|nr:class I SAM-dependent methyltransferase [Actinomadura xylanilytica]MDL4770771.1 class I SAM-dependent methyltransferase [Actinomadura xylanilytica]
MSLLDVACGTGEHLVALRALFGEVAGLDLAAGMRAVASRKLPGVPVHAGDMRGFALGRAFDAMCCLYSAVGYMSTAAELDAALERMAAHLTPGGVLVVEPWWTPGRFLDGHIADDVVRGGGRTISRVSLSTRDGGAARQETHYTVAGQDGIRSFVHVQRLTLFRPEDYAAAFRRAGLKAEYTAHDAFRSGRGLYVGVREGGGR